MPFVVVCSSCKGKVKIGDALVGKVIKCPRCAHKLIFRAKAPAANGAAKPAAAKPAAKVAAAPKAPAKATAPKAAAPKVNGKASAAAPPQKSVPSRATTAPPRKTVASAPSATATKPAAPAQKKPAVKPSRLPAPPPPPAPEEPFDDMGPVPAPVVKAPPRPAPTPRKDDDDEGKSRTPLLIGAAVVLGLISFFVWFGFGSGEGSVTGVVTLDGAPLAKALVIFEGQGESNKAPVRSETDDSGNYRLIGFKGGGIPPGKYKVSLSKMVAQKGILTKAEEDAKGEDADQIKQELQAENLMVNIIPKKYQEATSTTLEFDVTTGSNVINLELNSK